MSTKVPVKVFLNLTESFRPYRHDNEPWLLKAAEFESPFPACGHVEKLLEIIFFQLSIDAPTADWAIEWQTNNHRSLSVGDIVAVGEQAWAVEPVGWKPVSVDSSRCVAQVLGTCPESDGEALK